MHLSLRPAGTGDEVFLFQVYAGVRREEVAAWGWDPAQQNAFLRMQFALQQRGYAAAYPEAGHWLIVCDHEPAGRLIVLRTEQEIRLVDISLLTEFRRRGIGSTLIRELIDEARTAGKPLRLQVMKSNPAARLYERLGFSITGDMGIYLQMEWKACLPDAVTSAKSELS